MFASLRNLFARFSRKPVVTVAPVAVARKYKRLTPLQVTAIRESNKSDSFLAHTYNVSVYTIRKAREGVT